MLEIFKAKTDAFKAADYEESGFTHEKNATTPEYARRSPSRHPPRTGAHRSPLTPPLRRFLTPLNMLELSEEEAELRKNPCAPIERKPAGGRGFGERDGRGRGRGRGEGGRGGGRDWEEPGRATRGARAGASGCRATCARERAPRQPRDSAGSDGVPRSPASRPGRRRAPAAAARSCRRPPPPRRRRRRSRRSTGSTATSRGTAGPLRGARRSLSGSTRASCRAPARRHRPGDARLGWPADAYTPLSQMVKEGGGARACHGAQGAPRVRRVEGEGGEGEGGGRTERNGGVSAAAQAKLKKLLSKERPRRRRRPRRSRARRSRARCARPTSTRRASSRRRASRSRSSANASRRSRPPWRSSRRGPPTMPNRNSHVPSSSSRLTRPPFVQA